eukprot:3826042-Lingulodinium_polyedra.AAC.1
MDHPQPNVADGADALLAAIALPDEVRGNTAQERLLDELGQTCDILGVLAVVCNLTLRWCAGTREHAR